MTWNVNSHPIWETVMWDCLMRDRKELPMKGYINIFFSEGLSEGCNMQHHTDWPYCQISVTVNLGGSHPYPIYVTNRKTKKSVKVEQKPGQAILYLGHNISHSRDEFKGDWYSQLFLHYVIDNDYNENAKRFNQPVHKFRLKDKMSQIFYPKEVKKVKYDKEDYPMNEELKDNLIPFEPPLFLLQIRNLEYL